MGKITRAQESSTRLENLNDPEVRNRLRREAERAAREEQRRKLARGRSTTTARA